MRLAASFCLILVVGGISSAQDTNFSAGPQYLITYGSPQFLRPISTPSISLEAPLPPIPNLPQIGPEVSNEPYTSNPDLSHQADLFPIYYGYQPIPEVEIASPVPAPVFAESMYIELSSKERPVELPARLFDAGVTGSADASLLRTRGLGMSLGESAAYWRAHKVPAARVYTNRDIERLHGG